MSIKKIRRLVVDSLTAKGLQFQGFVSTSSEALYRYGKPELGVNPTTQNIKVFCSVCAETTIRPLRWVESDYGCPCLRSKKIGDSQKLTAEEFEKRCKFKRRKLKLLSKYHGMAKKVKVKCLRCERTWHPLASNVSNGHGCLCQARLLRDETSLKRHGPDFARKFRAKASRTMVKRYGKPHALQNKKLFDKSRESMSLLKPFKLGATTVLVQGYEPQALSYMLQHWGLQPSQICCGAHNKSVPIVPYVLSGVKKIYHPDIFIPHKNLIVEVKSLYTYKAARQVNRKKRAACLKAGYRFRYLVMNKDGTRVCKQQLKASSSTAKRSQSAE